MPQLAKYAHGKTENNLAKAKPVPKPSEINAKIGTAMVFIYASALKTPKSTNVARLVLLFAYCIQ